MRAPVALHSMALWALLPVLSVGGPDPEAAVLEAARQGDLSSLQALVDEGVDVNVAHGDGMTPLHYASERRDVEMARFLVTAGADVGARTRIGEYRPLHLAGRGGSGEIVGLLLEAGADPNAATTNTGVLPIHLAAGAGAPDALTFLVEHGADPDAREGSWGQTPLVFAASANRPEAIEALLALGADPSMTTQVVDVPRRAASDQRAEEHLNELLEEFRKEEKGDPDTWEPTPAQVREAILASREVQRETDREEVSDYEEEEEEDRVARYPDLVSAWGGLTPLLHASRQGHHAAVAALLDGGADIDQPSSGDGTTPLLMATLNGHFDLAAELLRRGANPNLASEAGATPLYVAIEREWAPRAAYAHPLNHYRQEVGYLELMERLLEAGADPNVRIDIHPWYKVYNFNLLGVDSQGATPFWRAAYGLDIRAMQLLLEYGADPTVATRTPPARGGPPGGDEELDPSGLPPAQYGQPSVTPLHAATGAGYGLGRAGNQHRYVPGGWMPVVRFLVEEIGLDVNARDHQGYTPLHNAAARGDTEMIRYLVDHGADVTVVSRRGQTTADMANGPVQRISPFPAAIRLLEDLGSDNNDNCVGC